MLTMQTLICKMSICFIIGVGLVGGIPSTERENKDEPKLLSKTDLLQIPDDGYRNGDNGKIR